jgi:hypothetical protein
VVVSQFIALRPYVPAFESSGIEIDVAPLPRVAWCFPIDRGLKERPMCTSRLSPIVSNSGCAVAPMLPKLLLAAS